MPRLRDGLVRGRREGSLLVGCEHAGLRRVSRRGVGVPGRRRRAPLRKDLPRRVSVGTELADDLAKAGQLSQSVRGFDYHRVARFNQRSVERLLRDDAGIVRHRGKIESTINNAKRAVELEEEFGSLSAFFWEWVPPKSERPRKMTKGLDEARQDADLYGPEQGAQGPGLVLRRADHGVRLHAGDGVGERSLGGLLRARTRRKDSTCLSSPTRLYGNAIQSWLIAVAVSVGRFIALRLVEQVLIVRVERLTQRTSTIIDDVVVGALRKTKLALPAHRRRSSWARSGCRSRKSVAFRSSGECRSWRRCIQAGIWLSTAFRSGSRTTRKDEDDGANRTTMNALSLLGRIALWATVLLLILDNLGVDVTALVTGLGIGGIAIALAVQNVLSDLFASLSIVLDKPFVNGDFIVVGEMAGSVEHIGIKTTRIRSISGEQLVFSNNDLLNEPYPQLRPNERAAGRVLARRHLPDAGGEARAGSRADSGSRGRPSRTRDSTALTSRVTAIRRSTSRAVYYVESSDYATAHGHPPGGQPVDLYRWLRLPQASSSPTRPKRFSSRSNRIVEKGSDPFL